MRTGEPIPVSRAPASLCRGTGDLRRTGLGLHLGCDPALLKFNYGEHGKPFLAEPAGTGLEFNVSHSADLALYAVALECPVGVDVEFMKPEGSWLRIAGTVFQRREFDRLSSLPEEEMREEFFELWAAKEARAEGARSRLATSFGRKRG